MKYVSVRSHKIQRVLFIGLFSTIFFSYQNCSPQMKFGIEQSSVLANGEPAANPPNNPPQITDPNSNPNENVPTKPKIVIEDGKAFINRADVKVGISDYSEYREMYVTGDVNCNDGGVWETVAAIKNWQLAQANAKNFVYAKFRNRDAGKESYCLSASIVYDNTPPTTNFVSQPAKYIQELIASFSFNAEDNLSGVEYFECRFDSLVTAKCPATTILQNLKEGDHTFSFRAVDKASNASDFMGYSWWIDQTKPTAMLTLTPPTLSNKNSATFEFISEDSGSGVDKVVCRIGTAVISPCVSPLVVNNLADGAQQLKLYAIDKAGNTSDAVNYNWNIDTMASGEFEILGVSGGSDTKIDNLLGTVSNPKITWTKSDGAIEYKVSVLSKQGDSVVCADKSTTANEYQFLASDCRLTHAMEYRAQVIALDEAKNSRTAQYAFIVDIEGPQLAIVGSKIIAEQGTATIDFSASDFPSGIEKLTCQKISGNQTTDYPCEGLMSYALTNLVKGDYSFKLMATDKAGNSSASESYSFKISPVVCDPFSPNNMKCKKGIKSNLYYLSGQALKNPPNNVNTFIQMATKSDVLIYLSKIFVPTRVFTDGFSTTENNLIRDSANNVLFEYFALDMETILKLGTNDTDGDYQLALLSDDGAILELQNNGGNELLVNNDGTHATKLGCATKTVSLDSNARVPVRIRYYQGPRTNIALTLLWRKTISQNLSDPRCGTDAPNGVDKNAYWFGPNFNDFTTKYAYGDLLTRGWKPLEEDNFILNEELP